MKDLVAFPRMKFSLAVTVLSGVALVSADTFDEWYAHRELKPSGKGSKNRRRRPRRINTQERYDEIIGIIDEECQEIQDEITLLEAELAALPALITTQEGVVDGLADTVATGDVDTYEELCVAVSDGIADLEVLEDSESAIERAINNLQKDLLFFQNRFLDANDRATNANDSNNPPDPEIVLQDTSPAQCEVAAPAAAP